MRKRSANSFVPAIVKSDGVTTTSQNKVINEFISFYKNLLGSESEVNNTSTSIFEVGPVLTEVDRFLLTEPIGDLMIKDALFHIGDDKAPGPDGFNAAFFKENWDVVKSDFIAAVHEFFHNGKILKGI